jgi:hypothetical protein
MADTIATATVQRPAFRVATLSLLLVAATLIFLHGVSDLPFHTKGEPREALVVQNMVAEGEYVLVLRNGNEIPSKPPLFHWLGALAAHSLGRVSEEVVRAPSVAAALLLLALTALLGFRWWGTAGGLASATALATSQQFIVSATVARVDMVLAACVSVAIATGCLALSENRKLPLAFYFAVALGVLAKGPIGFVLPAAVLAVYAAVRRRMPSRSELRLGAGLLIALVPLTWYAAAWWVGGDAFVEKLLFKENVYRVLDPESVSAGHVKPLWFYGPSLLGSAAPWSLCLPAVAVAAWKRRATLDEDGLLVPLVWLIVTVALFSLSPSKRSVYLLPCFPAVALLAGHWAVSQAPKEPLGTAARAVVLGLAGIVAAAVAMIALEATGLPAIGWIEPFVGNESDRANLAALLIIAEAMRTRLVVWALAALTLIAIAAVAATTRRRLVTFTAIASLVTLTVGLAGVPMQREMAKRGSVAPFVAQIEGLIADNEPVYFYRGLDYAAAYYLARPIPSVENAEEAKVGSGRNRVWYFVWEPSIGELCGDNDDSARYSCKEHGRYDFFDNPKLDDLLLISTTRTRARRRNRTND